MTDTIATDNPFTVDEQHTLRTLACMIVPASSEHNIPGADDEIILADIVSSARSNEAEVRAGIQFAQAVEAEVDGTLQDATDRLEGRVEMSPLVSLVMQCYYRDDRVMASLGMEARAPFPKGFEVEQGDWSMLEEVAQRGKIWRDA